MAWYTNTTHLREKGKRKKGVLKSTGPNGEAKLDEGKI